MAVMNLGGFSLVPQYIGESAKSDLFGTNFLFNRDGTSVAGQIDQNYATFVDEANVTTIRFPGGTLAETRLDLSNPDSLNANFMEPGYEAVDPTVPLSSFLDFCASANAAATLVLPTYRFLTDEPDGSGHRGIDTSEEANLRSYIQFAVSKAGELGTKISAFEIGNEWYVDNSATFGFRMSPVEYGRIVNYMSAIIEEEINSYEQAGGSTVDDPAIVVQIGPGGAMEQFTPQGFRPPEDYTGKTVPATELIINQINDMDARKAIDGILMHRYLHGSDDMTGEWVYNPFKTWSALTSGIDGFKAVDQYVTEWNVSSSNKAEQGLSHFDSIIELFREMMISGVDHANIWGVQQNTQNRMIANTGIGTPKYGDLTFGGVAFDICSTQLRGLRAMKSPEEIQGMAVNAFGSSGRTVVALTNRNETSKVHSVDLAKIAAGGHHVTIYRITAGSDGKPVIFVETLKITSSHLWKNLTFAAQESVVIVVARADAGVTIEGYNLSDRLEGSIKSDTILGGIGNDSCFGDNGNDLIDGEEGNDYLTGGNGADTIYGGVGNDYLDGGAGNDTFILSAGQDTIVGGTGVDIVSLEQLSEPVILDLSSPESLSRILEGTSISGIEGYSATLFDDLLMGDSANDILLGNAGDDLLYGGAGADQLYGDDGEDSISGGDGQDSLYGGLGSDCLDGGGGNDQLKGGDGSDSLFGGTGDDSIEGETGDDMVAGGDGSDRLFGGEGQDSLMGELDSDLIYGGGGNDQVSGGGGRDSLFGDDGWDTIWGGDGDDVIAGGAGSDELYGEGGVDTIYGGEGNDYLAGGDGNDTLNGDSGDDILDGGEGADRLVGSLGADNVFGGGGNDLVYGGDGGDLLMGGSGFDVIYGDNGNDHLVGQEGDDLLFGGAGNDVIVGGSGSDCLSGGTGSDLFIFVDEFGRSRITDFQNNIDTLQFHQGFYDEGMTVQQFVDTYAHRVGNSIVFDFGDQGVLTLSGMTTPSQLYDDVILVA